MSFASYRRLPALSTYAQALHKLQHTQPIRGRDPLLYPLGERRYADKFAIRMVGDTASMPSHNPSYARYQPIPGSKPEDIELHLYGMPVIVFHTDNTITINNNFVRWTAADCWFISEVLYRYVKNAYTTRGMLVLNTHGHPDPENNPNTDYKIVVRENQLMRLSLDEGKRTIQPADKQPMRGLKLNRKATNNIRARYGDFYRYVKGMVGIRKQGLPVQHYNHATRQYDHDTSWVVQFSGTEMATAVPSALEMPNRHHNASNPTPLPLCIYRDKVTALIEKPAKRQTPHQQMLFNGSRRERGEFDAFNEWREEADSFLKLITPTPNEEETTANFARAFARLAVEDWLRIGTYMLSATDETYHRVPVTTMPKLLDEVLFKAYSEEALEWEELAEGRIPNARYEKWITRETD